MTHTSGIRHYRDNDFGGDDENMRPVASLEEGIKVFKDDPLLFKPGEYYSYSSYAVNLLQGVVEKASGQGFEDYMRQHVWSPAGGVQRLPRQLSGAGPRGGHPGERVAIDTGA